MSSKVGQNIRRLRQEQGMSLEQLAVASSLGSDARRYIWAIESGRLKEPSAMKLLKIARALGVRIEELLEAQ